MFGGPLLVDAVWRTLSALGTAYLQRCPACPALECGPCPDLACPALACPALHCPAVTCAACAACPSCPGAAATAAGSLSLCWPAVVCAGVLGLLVGAFGGCFLGAALRPARRQARAVAAEAVAAEADQSALAAQQVAWLRSRHEDGGSGREVRRRRAPHALPDAGAAHVA